MTATTTAPTNARQAPAGIEIISSRLRSTNLERDVQAATLGPVHIGVRAQDMLERVGAALRDRSRTRAWSVTGPYGSGKSTLALITATLLGRDAERRSEADKALAEVSPTLAEDFIAARDEIAPDGFLTCLATARREPLLETVARAIGDCVAHAWGRRKRPAVVGEAIAALEAPGYGNSEVLHAVRMLCQTAPVLLVIDEFGKSLEHLAVKGEFSTVEDVFLLQELAELGAGVRGLPLFILTLQHLSFGDYASRATKLQGREWAKIQGRFEDVLQTTHLGDSVELIRRTLDHHEVSPKGRKLIAEHAQASSTAWAERGLAGILPADAEVFADLYPLHPLTAVVAPLLAAQIGQHDRSMTGFIANDEPHTVRRFLENYATPKAKSSATVKLADIFDYFLSAGRTTVLASTNASRWIEIDQRISEANGLSEQDQAVLKTVGLLNLVDSSGALRASMDMILFALCDPMSLDDGDIRHEYAQRVKELSRDFLVYREFSDEYRVWRGSNVDLNQHLNDLIDNCTDHAAVNLVSAYLPTAVVAGKHSQQTGMLRHFITSATDVDSAMLTGPSTSDAADGLLIFHFGDVDTIPAIRTERPIVVGVTREADSVLAAAKYLHALEELPDHADLDSTATIEVSERTAQAAAELAARVAEAFSPNDASARWFHLVPQKGLAVWSERAARIRGRSLAALVSTACETVFPHAPHIRNEMLGRHTLTSMGAKARRELMAAMIRNPTHQYLGIEGYGPDRAMYSGVLEFLSLHRPVANAHGDHHDLLPFGFVEPEPHSTLYPAWSAMREQLQAATAEPVGLDEVFAALEAPPFGLRPGVIPIIVLTALIIGSQEYAVFEEGTYQTRLTEALAERMLKSPERFSVKAMGTQAGPRQSVVVAIAEELGTHVPAIPPQNNRNVAPLAVTRDLLDKARTLTAYADHTQQLSPTARAVRTVLKTAREPDTLLFSDLPAALGIDPIPPKGRLTADAVRGYAESLTTALTEITSSDHRLRDQVVSAIADAFYLPTPLSMLRQRLALQTRHLADVALAEPRVRGVIRVAQDDTLSDEEWLDPFVVRIAGRGLSDWRDADLSTFAAEAKAVAQAIERLVHLHQPAVKPADNDPVSSRVVTLTTADGHEKHTVIHIPESERIAADEVLQDALRLAEKKLGRHGHRVLLALLAETVIGDRDATPTSSPRRKSSR